SVSLGPPRPPTGLAPAFAGANGRAAPAPVRLPQVSAPPAALPAAAGAGAAPAVAPVTTVLMSAMNGGGSGDGNEGRANEERSSEPTSTQSDSIRDRIRSLPEDQRDRLLVRVVRGDAKGRPFGTPRNPRMPTVEEFNPRVEDVRAGDLEQMI